MSEDGMRWVALLQEREIGRVEPDLERRYRVIEMRQLRGTDDRRGDVVFRQQPGQRDLRRFDAFPRRQLRGPIGNRGVGGAVVITMRQIVGLAARGVAAIVLTP